MVIVVFLFFLTTLVFRRVLRKSGPISLFSFWHINSVRKWRWKIKETVTIQQYSTHLVNYSNSLFSQYSHQFSVGSSRVMSNSSAITNHRGKSPKWHENHNEQWEQNNTTTPKLVSLQILIGHTLVSLQPHAWEQTIVM